MSDNDTNLESALVETDDQQLQGDLASLSSSMTNQQLKRAAEKETNRRQIIAEFVQSHLKKDVDYGVIESTSSSGKTFKSKPTLFKPGQEKIFSLFGLTSELVKDEETISMLSEERGLVAYKCNVYKNGVKIAEGRGAAKVGDNKRDANATIKIAEKRARMDACLSLGFSEHFTQDLDDPDYRNNGSPQQAGPASDKQKDFIRSLLEQKGIKDRKQQLYTIARTLGIEVTEVGNLNRDQASDMIEKLQNNEHTQVRVGESVTAEERAEEILEENKEEPEPEPVYEDVEEPMIVDDEMKETTLEMFSTLPVKEVYKYKVLKEAAGTINAKSIKTDDAWRALHDRCAAIHSGEEEVPKTYQKAGV